MPPTRQPIQDGNDYVAASNQVTQQLNASGDSSACEFGTWHTHVQVLNGMYQRKWVYESMPQGSPPSGPPAVSYNYVDINFTVQVIEDKEYASYCSGLYQPQQLAVYSDSTLGGLGISGTFTTSAVGYERRAWLDATDTEYNCQQTTNGIIAKQPGSYNTNFDTSASIASHVADLLNQAHTQCDRFNPNIVEY
tara:strand:- start:63 stop:641 length:579 start_codon:yes stop_codon:yes gene_type:complete